MFKCSNVQKLNVALKYVLFDVRCALAVVDMLQVVKIWNLLPSSWPEIVWVLSDGLAAARPARRITGFFRA